MASTMEYIYRFLIGLTGLSLVRAQLPDFSINSASPEHLHAHIFIFGNGSVPIAEGPNPFANNALNGSEFMAIHQGWEDEHIQHHRKNAIEFWRENFGLDGDKLILNKQGAVIPYQMSPAVNERAYMMNTPCPTPSEGHEVIDGGFQLFVTDPNGAEGFDRWTKEPTLYPFQSNLVYSWLKIHVRESNETCGVAHPPPEWIVLQYQTYRPAKWTTNAIMFELEVIGVNYFGTGKSLGMSAPLLTATDITNRLLNYITFDTPGPEVEYLNVTAANQSSADPNNTTNFPTDEVIRHTTTEEVSGKEKPKEVEVEAVKSDNLLDKIGYFLEKIGLKNPKKSLAKDSK